MAICYARNEIIHADDHIGVLRAVAYAARCRMSCPITGGVYDWTHQRSDVLFREVLLPETAPAAFKDPPRKSRRKPDIAAAKTQRRSEVLWQAVDQSERVFDRKAKIWRFRKNGQLAYRLVLALPANRPIDEVCRLTVDFAHETFISKGVPAEVVGHKAEDAAGLNIHVHVTYPTRELGPEGLSEHKARHLLPDFVGHRGKKPGKGWSRIRTGHDWPQRWAAYQNAWYRRQGIELEVDPIAAEPGIHIGKWRDPEIEAERRAADEARQIESAEIARDPERLVKVIEDQKAVFGLKDILRHLKRNGVLGREALEIAERLLALPEIVALEPKVDRLPEEKKPASGEALLYTTRAILKQEDRIHENIEYLYADVAREQPLPAGMLVHAELLVAERTLDPEQAEGVRHTMSGPGIRIIQGVAGAGKSHLLTTIRMVFEAFGFKVIAMAPTNLVVSDLRKNGFDACTLHRFIGDVERGKRRLAPKTVLIVDEAGMANVNLYDRLIQIARAHNCRLILSGDDRQLPPIGRGGIYGKIRHMVGDAQLSKVRRQSQDWMKTASESLSRWDVAAGTGAYAERGALTWNETPEQSMYALIEQCARDLDADPVRDLKNFFVYCALNKSADVLNNEIQERIWRDPPAAESYELKCCRGKVRVRCGDRIQFHETDLKRGLFNGAIGTISGLYGDGIHVRLDSGDEVAFEPEEFQGWGLGYAGTVHRGQGQTKHRSYVLYDSARLWNAALTYVALTRHKETTALFVPRTLAADQHTLVQQMSQTVSQPLASDYDVIDRDQALEEARIALHPPATWTVTGADGPHELNLYRKRDAEDAESAFRRMPAEEFSIAYGDLRAMARNESTDHPYPVLQRAAETIAMARGFLPGSGKEDPNALMGLFRKDEREFHAEDPILAREAGAVDVSPMVIDPAHVEVGLWRRLARRLKELDDFVRDAFHDRLAALRARVRPDTTINAALGLAQFALRLSSAKGTASGLSDAEIKAAVMAEGARRQVFKPFKVWRRFGPGVDDYEEVSQIDGIRQAFSSKELPSNTAEPLPVAQKSAELPTAPAPSMPTHDTRPVSRPPAKRSRDDGLSAQ